MKTSMTDMIEVPVISPNVPPIMAKVVCQENRGRSLRTSTGKSFLIGKSKDDGDGSTSTVSTVFEQSAWHSSH